MQWLNHGTSRYVTYWLNFGKKFHWLIFLLFVFYIVRKPRKSANLYLLMNINELVLLP